MPAESVTQSVTESAAAESTGRAGRARTYGNDPAGTVRVAQHRVNRPDGELAELDARIGNEMVYIDVEGWQVITVNEEIAFVRFALARLDAEE
jgi:hypothetical protein